ncbi:hypothetical protein JXA47_12550, partial [Candidatus Sumerlaeota bacterium]|nr:hypothetical protein [Candidatus Sumerlaeota bacterium]
MNAPNPSVSALSERPGIVVSHSLDEQGLYSTDRAGIPMRRRRSGDYAEAAPALIELCIENAFHFSADFVGAQHAAPQQRGALNVQSGTMRLSSGTLNSQVIDREKAQKKNAAPGGEGRRFLPCGLGWGKG